MKNCRVAVVFLIPFLVAACAVGYQARGTLSDVPGELHGKGYPGNSGGGRFVLSDPAGHLTCDGQASPPSASTTPSSCSGESGEGVVRCSDGRRIPMHWEAISCRSWKGSAVDEQGNRLEFRVERP